MQVLLVRHAIATERDPEHPGDDGQRALTDKGRQRMERSAATLAALLPRPKGIFSSPLVRTLQTADLLSAAWGGKPRPEVVDVLAPGNSPQAVLRWLTGESRHDLVVVVGHEPGCSELLSQLVAGRARVAVDFKKGAAALIEARTLAGSLRGTLLWLATPRILRAATR